MYVQGIHVISLLRSFLSLGIVSSNDLYSISGAVSYVSVHPQHYCIFETSDYLSLSSQLPSTTIRFVHWPQWVLQTWDPLIFTCVSSSDLNDTSLCSLADHPYSLFSSIFHYIYPLRHSFLTVQPCVSSAFRDELLSCWRKRKCGQIMLHNLKQEHCGHVLRMFPSRIFNRKFQCGVEKWTQLRTWRFCL